MVRMKYLFGLLFILLIACNTQKSIEAYTVFGEAQGSTYHIKYIAEEIPELKKSVDSILEVIDISMSAYRDDSLISKINKGEELVVDNHFENVFLASQQIWKESSGLFDPTVGVLVDAWGFGRLEKHQKPSQNTIDSLLQFVGFDKVKMDSNGIIHKDNPQIYFDFNAIAQGYSVDVLSKYLKSKGVENFIVEVGGEMYVSGKNILTNTLWTIGIDNPLQQKEEGKRTLIAVIQLSDKGMATSGNYRKVWEDETTGEKYVHTINPKTGYTQLSDVLSVTVIADNAMQADGYATAFMVMGLKASQQFLLSHPELQAYFNYSENGELKSFATDGFKKLIVNEMMD